MKEELSKPQDPTLAALLTDYYEGRNAGAWSRNARIGNLKDFAAAVNFLTEKDIFTLEDLEAHIAAQGERAEAINTSMKAKHTRLNELKELLRLITRGAAIESVAPEVQGMSERAFFLLMEKVFSFEFYPDIESEDDLGRHYTEDLPIPAELKGYVDYEAYGRDVSINEGGRFAPGGYIVQTGDLKEIYRGIQDIPKEHKVFSMPQLSIREQMAAYKEVIDRFPPAADRPRPEPGRDER